MSTKNSRSENGAGSAVRRVLRNLGAPSTEPYRASMQRRERYAVGLMSGYVAHRSNVDR